MTDYKATLNLPETAFPMKSRPAPARAETPEVLERHRSVPEAAGHWRRPSEVRPARWPSVRQRQHSHRSRGQQDSQGHHCPLKTLAGYDAPYVPGWDCHDLPIEHKVETTHGKNLPADKTRELCREYAAEQIEGQKADFIRLGVLGEWDNPTRP